MTLPNILTIARLFLTLIFIVFMRQGGPAASLAAFLVFSVAAVTDFADGYIAKRYNLISDFGKLMDPIADKFLMLSAFFLLMQSGYVALWMFVAIALREVVVTVSRIRATRQGQVIAAEKSGKIKTILQIAVIIVMLLYQNLQEFSQTAGWADATGRWWGWLIQLLLLATVYMTVQSGWEYFQSKKRSGC